MYNTLVLTNFLNSALILYYKYLTSFAYSKANLLMLLSITFACTISEKLLENKKRFKKHIIHICSCSNSPESGLGTSHTSLPGADSDPDQYDGHGGGDGEFYDNIYETEVLPALGTCKALYPFEGKGYFIFIIHKYPINFLNVNIL